jgi:hypothetical protein
MRKRSLLGARNRCGFGLVQSSREKQRACNVGSFTSGQKRFLEFHRDMVLLKAAR